MTGAVGDEISAMKSPNAATQAVLTAIAAVEVPNAAVEVSKCCD